MLTFRQYIIYCKCIFICLLLASTACCQKTEAKDKPNIILILADDLGHNDLSTYGNKDIPTPNIDQLASEGVRFTNGYCSSPICSPSRAGLMTGRYQQRFGFEFQERDDPIGKYTIWQKAAFVQRAMREGDHVDFNKNTNGPPNGLPEQEISIASLLKKERYHTAVIGKWNLGHSNYQIPSAKGFDYFYGFYSAAGLYADKKDTSIYNKKLDDILDPAVWYREGNSEIRRNDSVVTEKRYLTFAFADEATNYIRRQKDSTFFLYLAFNAPHTPFQAPKEIVSRFSNVEDETKRVYYAMITALDEAIGKVLKTLEETGIAKNTLIIFASDNGGATYTLATDNEPLKGGKMSHFDGGLKVPLIISYPAKINGGGIYDYPVSLLDILPTCVSAANGSLPNAASIDGVDLIPYLNGANKNRPHPTLYWRNGYSKAIRKDDLKLYVNEKEKIIFLYDLSKDPYEREDLSNMQPEKVKELENELKKWEQHLAQPLWKSRFQYKLKVRDRKFIFPT
ncbi:sulfatase-like hydrolase/transferase [Danxiaibacter flavus]|uniref:Sulfatase-like hydrolase/transferase n=1 Tax=Danxiaibacter flavus TaxID=3049108 RepID=A0ABV3ZPK3_9BACT|nr:sulfatase-like hydrolase/transferase [Chitinophagaceae bacterium DXS]